MADRNPRILIVDDEAAVRWAVRDRLNERGYDIVEAGIAAEAIERVTSTQLDVVLLDVQLPDADVESVMQRMKSLQGGIEIILLADSSTHDRAIAMLERGAYDYVSKPVNLDEVTHRVGRAVELRALRREVHLLRVTQNRAGRRSGRAS